MEKKIIPFIRQKDYVLVGNAGMGAIGDVRLLKDEMIDEVFACKKYAPSPASAPQSPEPPDAPPALCHIARPYSTAPPENSGC